MSKDRTIISSETTYGLCQTQKAVEGDTIGREFHALLLRDTELVIIQPQASNVDVVCDNSTRNLPSAVHDTELLTGFHKRAGSLRSKEVVVPLWKVISVLHRRVIQTEHGLTQPPPTDRQFSEPTQVSAEPESTRSLKSCGGVPILIVAKYPISLALSNDDDQRSASVLRLNEPTRYREGESYWPDQQ